MREVLTNAPGLEPGPEETRALTRLRRVVEEQAGIAPARFRLRARAIERAAARSLGLVDYAALVEGERAEAEALVEALRVGETRFHRHAPQLAAIARRLPRLARAAGPRRLRLWSAGCATGEEAWTLAMLLVSAGLDGEVRGTDLSEPSLEVARVGRYAAARRAELPGHLAEWLVPSSAAANEEAPLVEVAAPLRALVRFERANVLDEDARDLGRWDVVLCRNVLCHLDAAARDRALERLVDALAPEGILVVGAGETVAPPPRVEAVREDGLLALRRRRSPATATTPPSAPSRPTAARAASVPPAPRPPAPRPLARGPAPSPRVDRHVIRLDGDLSDGARLSRALAEVARRGAAVLDLDGASCLDAEAARQLARLDAATHGRVRLRASRPAVVRWLERSGLAPLVDAAPPRGAPDAPDAPDAIDAQDGER